MSTKAQPYDPFDLVAVPDNGREFESLARAVGLPEGFALFFAVCDQQTLRERLVGDLQRRRGDRPAFEIRLNSPVENLYRVLSERLEALPDKPGCVMVTGLEAWMPGGAEGARTPFALNLNTTRDLFPQIVSCPLLFWVPSHILEAIALGAPDFCSVRSGLYTFAETPTEREALEETLRSLGTFRQYSMSSEQKIERAASLEKLLDNARELPPDRRDANLERRLVFPLAHLYAELTEYEKALALLKGVFEDYPFSLWDDRNDALKWRAEAYLLQGEIALRRSDHDEARRCFQEARPLFERVDDLLGQANCILKLGDVALRRSDHEEAWRRFVEAWHLYGRVGNLLGQANCILRLGDIALRRSDHEVARRRFEEARPLYERAGDLLGNAHCVLRLGDLALARSNYEEGRQRFEEARSLYRRTGYLLGQANCIFRLGDIALRRSDHEEARRHFEEARALYEGAGDILGQANCKFRMGDIVLRGSNPEEAQRYYEEARLLYERVVDLVGQSNCIRRMGDIALSRSDPEEAQRRYEEALSLYERMGNIFGQANCVQGLGDLSFMKGDQEGATHLYRRALEMYEGLSEPYSTGQTHSRLARTGNTEEQRRFHLHAARDAWTSIDRFDLLEDLKKEFPEVEELD